MAQIKLAPTIDQTTIAYFDAAIDSYIAEIWAAVDVEGTPSNCAVVVTMLVTANNDTASRTFTFKADFSDTTNTLVTAMIGAWTTGVAASITASAFDAISAVTGSVSITVTY